MESITGFRIGHHQALRRLDRRCCACYSYAHNNGKEVQGQRARVVDAEPMFEPKLDAQFGRIVEPGAREPGAATNPAGTAADSAATAPWTTQRRFPSA